MKVSLFLVDLSCMFSPTLFLFVCRLVLLYLLLLFVFAFFCPRCFVSCGVVFLCLFVVEFVFCAVYCLCLCVSLRGSRRRFGGADGVFLGGGGVTLSILFWPCDGGFFASFFFPSRMALLKGQFLRGGTPTGWCCVGCPPQQQHSTAGHWSGLLGHKCVSTSLYRIHHCQIAQCPPFLWPHTKTYQNANACVFLFVFVLFVFWTYKWNPMPP